MRNVIQSSAKLCMAKKKRGMGSGNNTLSPRVSLPIGSNVGMENARIDFRQTCSNAKGLKKIWLENCALKLSIESHTARYYSDLLLAPDRKIEIQTSEIAALNKECLEMDPYVRNYNNRCARFHVSSLSLSPQLFNASYVQLATATERFEHAFFPFSKKSRSRDNKVTDKVVCGFHAVALSLCEMWNTN